MLLLCSVIVLERIVAMEREDSINRKIYEEEKAIQLNRSLKPVSKYITGTFPYAFNCANLCVFLLLPFTDM
ncbi:hypothetical protein EON64_09780 [archaeon]|nr:MAG: hypothetical protein EON64_09780 [archaeon]